MAGQPRFLVDVNAGRLAKWLRILGYDTLFIPDADDDELLRVALREGRVILTRDSRLMERRVVNTGQLAALFIRDDDLRSQLRQVVQAFRLAGLDLPPARTGGLLSRCIRCNVPLVEVEKEAVAGRVPPYVYDTQAEFMECPSCQRIYWQGTHWANMRRDLAELGER